MQLTAHTDYALRVLMYLTVHQDKRITIDELAEFFQVSKNHLVKVVHNLGIKGFINTARGKGGGISLAKPARQISVGQVVRQMESHFQMAECFNSGKSGRCRLETQCGLIPVLGKAVEQFLHVLDGASLADLLPPGSKLNGHEDKDLRADP